MSDSLTIYAPAAEVAPTEKLAGITGARTVDFHRAPAGTIEQITMEWDHVTATITLMPPELMEDHLNQFGGYVAQLKNHEIDSGTGRLIGFIRTMKQVQGIVIEPGFDPEGKCRKAMLGLTQFYNGLLFSDSSVYAPNGKLVIGPGAEFFLGEGQKPTAGQEARAERSRAILAERQVPVLSGPLFVEDDEEVTLRPAGEAASRTLVLLAIVLKAQAGKKKQDTALDIINGLNLWSTVSPEEKRYLEDTDPDPLESEELVWRLECIEVLLWALHCIDTLEWPGAKCDVRRLVDILKPREKDSTFIREARLRPKAEILDAQDLTLRIHWAIRQATFDREKIPSNLDWSSDADRVDLPQCAAAGIVQERHRTLNWLVNFMHQEWDRVDTPTW